MKRQALYHVLAKDDHERKEKMQKLQEQVYRLESEILNLKHSNNPWFDILKYIRYEDGTDGADDKICKNDEEPVCMKALLFAEIITRPFPDELKDCVRIVKFTNRYRCDGYKKHEDAEIVPGYKKKCSCEKKYMKYILNGKTFYLNVEGEVKFEHLNVKNDEWKESYESNHCGTIYEFTVSRTFHYVIYGCSTGENPSKDEVDEENKSFASDEE